MNDRINILLDSEATSFWLKKAIKELLERDVVDAWRDAETLALVMGDVMLILKENEAID